MRTLNYNVFHISQKNVIGKEYIDLPCNILGDLLVWGLSCVGKPNVFKLLPIASRPIKGVRS